MTRRYLIRIVKAIFVFSLFAFGLIQLHLRAGNDETNGNRSRFHPRNVNELKLSTVDSNIPRKQVNVVSNLSLSQPSIDEIRNSINFNNNHSEILNEDKFGPASDAHFVVVVQVHNRQKYLELLVDSFRQAADIDKILIIFSHDFHSEGINRLIRSIQFCRVMQIFYPFSIQLFPYQFPGEDPDDCPSDITKEEAESRRCRNWRYPDKYGHYRVARLTQIKHHWWWKMNYIFDGIQQLRNYESYVLLLEEDHYVSPDFLHVLEYIVANKNELCPSCHIIALGFYLKQYGSYELNVDKLAVYPWFSSRHNMGMALNRNIWNKIRNCSTLFCTYDDYNWDWSLMRINMQCLKDRLHVVYTKAPRVFHIGDCGVHSHKCQVDSSKRKVVQLLSSVRDHLFPSSLQVVEKSKRMLKPPKENGGWGDIRDHQLCKNNTRWSI